MSSLLAIYYYLKVQRLTDENGWYSVKDVSKVVSLSVDRTRRLLSVLVLGSEIETKIVAWHNEYRCLK